MPYKLSCTLAAHSQDVRGVASPTPGLVLSASRDTTAIAWSRDAPDAPFQPASVLRASSGYVSAVTYVPPSADAPKGYAVTGGQDAIINIFSLASPRTDADFSLIGHTQNVCALDASADGTIISGSWDSTAKVWKNFQVVYDLQGHKQSVWAVIILANDFYLTGSADKTIKLWNKHKCVHTFEGHTDAVRGLALITDIGFASCSNDGNIIIWTMEGDMVSTLSGHTSFVYALSVLPSGDLVSSGEDRTVRVWHDFECTQTIVHPAISVWAVSTMPNGDIVTGSSDNVVRVFSEAEERWASAEDLKAYDDQVASQALPAQQVENVKTSDVSVLSRPGTKPGQTVMVKNSEGVVEAHSWDSASGTWQKIGAVVDVVPPSKKQLYEGREYDYVFSIDVQEGAPALKLPYNVTENPFTVAQRFLERNELPMSYLDQVANFITTNTREETLGIGGNQYVDPYTGASRYQSSASSVPTGGSSYIDPYTGASRYAPAAASGSSAAAASSFQDPYTGATRYAPASSGTTYTAPAPVAAPSPKILPVRQHLYFKSANVLRMRGKLAEYDDAFREEISTVHLSVYPNELRRCEEMFVYLGEASDGLADSTPITEEHLEAITAILDRWPLDQRWPVLDLARLVCAFCPAAFAGPETRARFIEGLLKASDWDGSWERDALTTSKATNVLLTLRALANMLQPGTPIADAQGIIIPLTRAPYEVLTKTQRYALATLLFNFSCLTLDGPVDPPLRSAHLKLIFEVLTKEPIVGQPLDKENKEAMYRALVALGNVAYAAGTHSIPLEPVETVQAKDCLGVVRTVADPRMTAMARDIQVLL